MDRAEKIKTVVEEFLAKNYGETIEHFQIASLIGEKIGTQEYRYVVRKAEKKLLECGKMIANVRGVGYKVVDPDEYTGQSAKRVMNGARQIDYGAKILRNAPTKDMSQAGLQAYNAVNDRMMILQAALSGTKTEINMLSNKRQHPFLVAMNGDEKVG